MCFNNLKPCEQRKGLSRRKWNHLFYPSGSSVNKANQAKGWTIVFGGEGRAIFLSLNVFSILCLCRNVVFFLSLVQLYLLLPV